MKVDMKNKGNKLICYMFLVLCIALAIAIGMLLFTLTPPTSTPPNSPEQEEPNNNENNEDDDEQNNGNNNEGNNTESNDNNDDNNNGSEEIPTPTLTIPTNITLDLLQTNFAFEYSVTNLADFVVSISIDDTSIATIDSNNVITPLKVGETKIITSINTNPTIAKETTLKINDCVQNVNFTITNKDGSVPNIFFTGTSYILKLEQNILEQKDKIHIHKILKKVDI